MKTRLASQLLLPAMVSMLALVLACRDTGSPATVPVALPTEPPAQTAKPLSASDLEALDEFAAQQQAVGQDWDQFHQEFDQWRAGLTFCHRSSMQEALQEFAVGFNAVTEQARKLPRTSVNRDLSNVLIAAAEAEEAAFRQLRDRWQPNSLSLFETVEQQRSNAARAQKDVEDLALELQEELEKATDPEEVRALNEFSAAFDLIRDSWEDFHDDYIALLQGADNLDDPVVLNRLEQLIRQFGGVSRAISRLPVADAAEDSAGTLEETAEAELTAMTNIRYALAQAIEQAVAAAEQSDIPGDGESSQVAGALLAPMDAIITGVEVTLKEINDTIDDALDQGAAEDLEEIQVFIGDYGRLIERWDAFHQRYNEWRRIEGGCDRSEVLQSLNEFNIRIGEFVRRVRNLPQTGYLLPMYNLLVEAAEREEGAVRALRNSWQPFTVDAFIAVDRERDAANGLRREAKIALEELRNRP